MRQLLTLFLILLSSTLLLGQSSSLPLNFTSYYIRLCVTKEENLVLTSKVGEVGFANSIQSEWRKSGPKVEKEFSRPLVEQANFFNKDTGFVSGFIHQQTGKYNLIYHTTDGGGNWQAIDFGQDGWVDDATNLDNGEAWLSVAGSGIAYTRDHGFTWKKFKIPEIKQRFASIFFNTKHHGIIGSLWNLLAYTEDNCRTWSLLPTPLDQKKYSKTNKESRPEFDRVAIVGDLLFVKQEGLVFYSQKDSINWVWLKEYDDFYTDPANTALYLKTPKGNFVRVDHNLAPVHTYTNTEAIYDAKCKNGSLFIVNNRGIQKLEPDNKVVSALFATNERSNVDPAYIGYTGTGSIGYLNGKIYGQKDYNGKWEYICDLPFPVDNGTLSLIEYDMILYNRNDDSLFYLDLQGKEVIKRSKTKMLEEFGKAGIKKIIFNTGSKGCFHSYRDELVYTNENGVFINQGNESSGSKHTNRLPEGDDEIDGESVAEFSKKVPLLFNKANMASVADLAFTEGEYERCKKDILDFKAWVESTKKKKDKEKKTKFYLYQNNIDFDRLLSLVDSIKYLDRERLNRSLFDLNEFFSTTSSWKGLQLVNNNNETLSITNIYYSPNAFNFPWYLRLNGYSVATTNIEINKFLKTVYPSFLSGINRVEILHTLVRKLY